MKIGDLEIKGYAALAPMAGVSDRAMREICVEYGAAFCVGGVVHFPNAFRSASGNGIRRIRGFGK